MWGGFCDWTVATWLAIRSWPYILLALVLYLCTSGMLHVIPSYGCVSGESAYMSSGMTWGLVLYGCRGARPGVILTFYFPLTLRRGAGSGGTVVASFCVILRGCGGSGVSTLRSYAGGGSGAWVTAVLKMAAIFLRAVV